MQETQTKGLVLIFALIALGAAYVRFEQPEIWNDSLAALKAPGETGEKSPNNVTNPSEGSADPGKNTRQDTAQVISPDITNYVNSDHIRPVEQPVPPAPSQLTNADKESPKTLPH